MYRYPGLQSSFYKWVPVLHMRSYAFHILAASFTLLDFGLDYWIKKKWMYTNHDLKYSNESA